MGAYSYCQNCYQGLDPATLAEITAKAQVCPSCGQENVPNRALPQAFEELEERIALLEKKVEEHWDSFCAHTEHG